MKSSWKENVVIVVLALIALSVASQLYLLLTVSERVSVFLQISSVEVSYLSAGFGVFYAVGFLFWGSLSDSYGRRKILLLGMTLLSVVTFLVALVDDYAVLLVLRCLQGLFSACFPPVILAWLGETLPEKNRMKAIGLLSCGFLLSSIVGQTLGDFFIEVSFLTVMLGLGCFYTFGLVFLYGLLPNVPKKEVSSSVLDGWKAIPTLLQDKRLLRIYLSAIAVLTSLVIFYSIVVRDYQMVLVEMDVTLHMIRQVGLVGLLLTLVASSVIIRWGAERVLSVALAVFASAFVVQYLALLYVEGTVLLVSHFVFTCCIAFGVPALISLVGQYAKVEVRGIATAFYMFVLFMGVTFGNVVAQHISLLIAVVAVVLYIGCILLLGRMQQVNKKELVKEYG